MQIIKQHWKFLLFVCLAGLLGAYFTSVTILGMLNEVQIAMAVEKVGSVLNLQIIEFLQMTMYAVICGVLGLILSHKTGLWKPISFKKSTIAKVLSISVALGMIMYIIDSNLAGMINEVQTDLSLTYIGAAFTYGAVVEEVMLRLFFMSLIAFGIYKVFYRKAETVPVIVFSVANIFAALFFALGHLPATITIYGELTVPLVVRCMLFNGGMGLFFGYLYRKNGIHYAMLAHFGAHIGMISMMAYRAWMVHAQLEI